MKIVFISLLITVCYFGWTTAAEDCSAKIKEYRKCKSDDREKQHHAEKTKHKALDKRYKACFTDNGCAAPKLHHHHHGSSENGTRSESSSSSDSGSSIASNDAVDSSSNSSSGSGPVSPRRACKKALRRAARQQVKECVQKDFPSYTLPKRFHHHHEYDHHHYRRKLAKTHLVGCEKRDAVLECKRQLINSTRPTAEDRRVRFQANCYLKQRCLAPLSDECKAERKKIKAAVCKCKRDVHERKAEIRKTVKACENVPKATHEPHNDSGDGQGPHERHHFPHEHREGDHFRHEHNPHLCHNKKNYCQLGYDAWVNDAKSNILLEKVLRNVNKEEAKDPSKGENAPKRN